MLLQYVLGTLGYFVSDDPGVDGPGTRNAVMAFQKLHGLERDGVVGPQTREALASAAPVAPRPGTDARIEVDLAAQVAIVVAPDGAVTAINATTGAAATPTPPGRYAIFRQVNGWDPGPYGSLYRPKYFTGGIAFHGGVPVLARPASHGCVRLPDPAVDWLWPSGVAATGTPVVVY
jgi:lipoprotein-anchoring transpeptidase ErfK/SrfK